MKSKILALSAILFILIGGCANKSQSNGKKGPVITFTTNLAVGENIQLTLNAKEADQPDVWIDLNNNGVKDEGETVETFGEEGFVETVFKLQSQTVSVYGKVTEFSSVRTELTQLDVSGNTLLTRLNCNLNALSVLDVSKNTALKELLCGWNNLQTLDVSKNELLEALICDYGEVKLTSLKLNKNAFLESLSVQNNKLTSLDVSGCKSLKWLNCQSNELSADALNAMLDSLPDRTGEGNKGELQIEENPGANNADKPIAEKKGWTFD